MNAAIAIIMWWVVIEFAFITLILRSATVLQWEALIHSSEETNTSELIQRSQSIMLNLVRSVSHNFLH